jgi:DNA-directed RNA polymerase subunit alpha
MGSDKKEIDLKDVVEKDECNLSELMELKRQVYLTPENRQQVEKLASSGSRLDQKFSTENKAKIRRGVLQYILGKTADAAELLGDARQSKEGMFFLGLCQLDTGRYTEAAEAFDKLLHMDTVKSSDTEKQTVIFPLIEAMAYGGKAAEAHALLAKQKSDFSSSADGAYLHGLCCELNGKFTEAYESYDKAVGIEENHAKALFRLAYASALRGDDERSKDLLEKLRGIQPTYSGVLMNLGIMYEDMGQYVKASECYKLVAEANPQNWRAKLYVEDANACLNMMYDDDLRKKREKMSQFLWVTLADLRLSVRSRNCLTKMGVKTLADLILRTEDDLVNCRGLGETSLKEIKEVLEQRGLSLAKSSEVAAKIKAGLGQVPVEKEDIFAKPLSEFEWSARAKKCIERLKIKTVGEMLQKSPTELLSCKNFGHTSLTEVKQKLAAHGLALKADK